MSEFSRETSWENELNRRAVHKQTDAIKDQTKVIQAQAVAAVSQAKAASL